MLWIYYFLVLLSSPVSCFPTAKGKEGLVELLSENQVLSDNDIVRNIVNELKSLSSGNLSVCDQCTTRLAIGKSLSVLKPDLVSPVFTQWCIDTAYWPNSTCIATFSRNTVESSYTGTNFGHMLSLMDPFGYDGQLYCHFKETGQCPKPLTPNVTLADKWPPKQPKHNVAPEPSWNDTFNVLHISDFHVELDYAVGSEVNCTNSMCCTPHSKNKFARKTESIIDTSLNSFYNSSYTDNSFVKGSYIDVFKNTSVWTPATTFGSYNCDAPEILINSSMNSIVEYMEKNSLNYDFAIFTGDLLDHDEIKYTSYDLTVESEKLVFRDMKAKLKNMPVYPVLGNHDMFPYGELAQENHGFSNLFTWNDELLADLWQQYGWIDFDTSKYARKHYSGYSVQTKQGLKIISLNSNTWYRKNHYAYWNASQPDTFGQFEFLINELLESEEKDQRVWIVAHIPFATDSLPLPANLFVEIVERFSPYTIAGIFFGHTHLDQFEVLYSGSGEDSKTIENVLNHAWISQAITPWIENNPSWRYYTVDKKTFSIMNAYNFYTKLNETFTNGGSEPIWEFEYSSREGYDVDWPKNSPLNGTYWHLVAEKVRNSTEYRQIYRNYAMRFSPFVPNCFNSTDCEKDYCVLTSFTVDEYQDCIES